jgi:hypothetical protein
MSPQVTGRRAEIVFASTQPASRVARAAGVSAGQRDGAVLRCLVMGSFQPLLEAVHVNEALNIVPRGAEPRSPAAGVPQRASTASEPERRVP